MLPCSVLATEEMRQVISQKLRLDSINKKLKRKFRVRNSRRTELVFSRDVNPNQELPISKRVHFHLRNLAFLVQSTEYGSYVGLTVFVTLIIVCNCILYWRLPPFFDFKGSSTIVTIIFPQFTGAVRVANSET